MAWVKPFAAFKRNVSVAYAWEPVLVKAARPPEVTGNMVGRDWISEPMTMSRGLVGAKPTAVCEWAFAMAGALPEDDLIDLYPGTGAVAASWEKWRAQTRLPLLTTRQRTAGAALDGIGSNFGSNLSETEGTGSP